MAEVLLLLLFLLMLMLAWAWQDFTKKLDEGSSVARAATQRATEAEQAVKVLQPLLEEVKRSGQSNIATADELIGFVKRAVDTERKLTETESRLRSAEADVSRLREIESTARQALSEAATIDPSAPPAAVLRRGLAVLKSMGPQLSDAELTRRAAAVSEAMSMTEKARQIDPTAPASATLERGLEVLRAVGAAADPKALVSSLAGVNELKGRVAELEGEKAQVTRQRDNLMRREGGRGTTWPSCWIASDGSSQNVFDVRITDKGVVVRDIERSDRSSDPAIKLLGPFGRNTEISAESFRNGTARMRQWSEENSCRFFVKLWDDTGETNKRQYQNARRLVEQNFYIDHGWRR